MESPETQLQQSFLADDAVAVDRLLAQHAALRQRLNQGVCNGTMPVLAAAKSCEMVDVLMAHGARVESVSQWWAPGFYVQQVLPAVACHLVRRGAKLTIHAAAGIGLIEDVREMLDRDSQQVSARGGDGCHPLHFCADREIARLLLAHHADVEARDEDHDSTPVQWRIGDAPEVVRFLLQHGAKADIFLAAALGDLDLAKRLVAENPVCTSYRIGNNKGPFPGIGCHGRGGTIYQWTLGFNLSPHEVALRGGHAAIYEFLLEKSTPRAKFLVACTTANRALATVVLADRPDVLRELDDEDHALLAKFCWETNKDINAVRLMLDLGFPVDAREFNHGFTALHNAAWCGDPDLVRLLIERGHPTDVVDPNYNSTPIGWALHSCLEAKRHPHGRFAEVIDLLLAAGTPFDPQRFPVGNEAIDAVIRDHIEQRT